MRRLLIIGFFFQTAFVTVYAQSDTQSRIDSVKAEIEVLNSKIDSAGLEDITHYQLKKDIIAITQRQTEISLEIEEAYEDGILKYFNFLTIGFSVLGGLIAFFGVNIYNLTKIREELDKKVPLEVAKITKAEVDSLNKEFKEFRKHNELRTSKKFIILNKKNTDFPIGFQKTMMLFNVDISDKQNLVEVEKLEEALEDENLAKLKEADVVLIENKVPAKVWDVTNSKETYLKLAEALLDDTLLFYYGAGHYPDIEDSEKQLKLGYVSAPSQLYGNIMNMLKFQDEISKDNETE